MIRGRLLSTVSRKPSQIDEIHIQQETVSKQPMPHAHTDAHTCTCTHPHKCTCMHTYKQIYTVTGRGEKKEDVSWWKRSFVSLRTTCPNKQMLYKYMSLDFLLLSSLITSPSWRPSVIPKIFSVQEDGRFSFMVQGRQEDTPNTTFSPYQFSF